MLVAFSSVSNLTLKFRSIFELQITANRDSERAPLIRSYVQGLPSVYTESVGNFYSPLASPGGSMYNFNADPILGKYPPADLNQEQVILIFSFNIV